MGRDDIPAYREFTSTAQLADHLTYRGFGPARPRPDRSAVSDGNGRPAPLAVGLPADMSTEAIEQGGTDGKVDGLVRRTASTRSPGQP